VFRSQWPVLRGHAPGCRPACFGLSFIRAPAGGQVVDLSTLTRRELTLGIDVAERKVSRLIPKRRTPPSADPADVPEQPSPGSAFDRLPHRSYRSLACAFHPGRPRSPSAGGPPLQRHRASHGGMGSLSDRGQLPHDTAPSYLLRDRDAIYGDAFRHRVTGMQIQEVLTVTRSPWQNPNFESMRALTLWGGKTTLLPRVRGPTARRRAFRRATSLHSMGKQEGNRCVELQRSPRSWRPRP
jgi:hypothetical protein